MKKYQDLEAFVLPAGFRGRNTFFVLLWWFIRSTLFSLSPQPLFGWRRFLLRLFGAKIGKNVKIRSSVKITYPWKFKIGDNCWIGDDCDIYNLGDIIIGNDVAIAHKVYLCTGNHDYSKNTFDILSESIKIEDEVWIPNDVFIGPGVTIGRGVVIGARSTVFHDLPAGMICYGYPAKPVRSRLKDNEM